MEYRGIELAESVKLYKVNGEFNKQIKNALDKLTDKLAKNNHTLLSGYKDDSEKILIDFKCGHKPHLTRASDYKNGSGCPLCGNLIIGQKRTSKAKEAFPLLVKANGHILLSPFIKSSKKVLIDFKCGHKPNLITPNKYQMRGRCPICNAKSPEKAKEEFLKLLKINNHTLLSEYKDIKTHVLIDFNCGHKPHKANPDNYKNNGCRCPECAKLKRSESWKKRSKQSLSRNKFLSAIKSNGHILLSEYESKNKPVLIDFNCEKHAPQRIYVGNYNRGYVTCPKCNLSNGVEIICKWLDSNMIENFTEYRLSNKRLYDIFIPSKNLIIEIHGEQHYKKTFYSKVGRSLEEEQENDHKKRQYAEKLGFNYMEIDYREHIPKLALERFLKAFSQYEQKKKQKQYEQLSLF